MAKNERLKRHKMTAKALLAAYLKGERDFTGANLRGADLSGAHLYAADLSSANLIDANLRGANLIDANLIDANLRDANLREANLSGANLSRADLRETNLSRANVRGAAMNGARLSGANMREANLSDAALIYANLRGANLRGADFSGAYLSGAELYETAFVDLDAGALCDAADLKHHGRSSLDWRTVAKSYKHPRLKQFMMDCGVPPMFAEYMIHTARALGDNQLRSLMQSTFISYGGPDEPFARKLYAALRAHGVVTYFFPETATVGARIDNEVFKRVNEYDRILLVCSRASLDRGGVVNEIQETLDREAKAGAADFLLPIMLDDFVINGWKPAKLDLAERLARRVMGDFRGADTDQALFDKQLGRVIDALKVKPVPASVPHGGTP